MKRILCTIFILLSLVGYTQEHFTLSGKIVSAETNEPLSFSTISILGTSIGVVSNFLGEFELRIPRDHAKDTLLVSMLGYNPYTNPLSKMENDSSLIIALEDNIISLSEVEVNAHKLTALEIVEKVIESIADNYPISPYLLEGFTRSHMRECGKYVKLYEADFELYGQGYHKKSPEKIYINESRQSEQVANYQSVVLRGNRNPFIAMRHINDVLFRSYSLKTANKNYVIDGYTYVDDQLIYIIKTNHSKYENHTMYINAEDYALIKVNMIMATPEDEDWNPILNKGTSTDSSNFQVTQISKVIQFEKVEDRYYAKYMDWLIEGNLTNRKTAEEFCDWGFRFETMFDQVKFKNFEKPARDRLMIPHPKKDPKHTPYNALFWENYQLIQDFPITPQIIQDLEISTPLETQFKRTDK
ncbi:carboxypeptidase-like regulatory domain-containing protein [Ekhidna sp.]